MPKKKKVQSESAASKRERCKTQVEIDGQVFEVNLVTEPETLPETLLQHFPVADAELNIDVVSALLAKMIFDRMKVAPDTSDHAGNGAAFPPDETQGSGVQGSENESCQ